LPCNIIVATMANAHAGSMAANGPMRRMR